MLAARPTKKLRLWIALTFAAVAAVIAAVLVPMAAEASAVQLSGTVTGSTGKALSGVSVQAMQLVLGIPMAEGSTTTSTSGSYSIANLPAGADYTLYFGASTSTYPQYLGDTSDLSSAQTFGLNAIGGSHTTVNASLAASGNISGTIKSITHANLAGYTVRAFADGSDATPVRSAVSASTGVYTITGLEPGSYQLEALDTAATAPYGPVFSGASTSLEQASTVAVGGSVTTAYSFVLGKAGGISGTVTGATTSGTKPLGGVRVTPYLMGGTSPSFTSETTAGMPSTVTSATGAYSLHGLMPGFYTLEFTPSASTPLTSNSDAYGQSFLGGGDGYVLTPGQTVHVLSTGATVAGVNEELAEEANATINVTDSGTAAPVANILVTIDHLGSAVDQPGDNAAQSAATDSSGSVTFHGLQAGFYQVIIGSNTGVDGTITTYQRQNVSINGELIGGETTIDNIQATLKDPQGLYATTTPTLSCCGSAPYFVGDDVAVDPADIAWSQSDVNINQTTVQWYRDGAPIPGADNSNYQLQANDYNQSITAVVTGHSFSYGVGTATTSAITPEAGTFYANGGGGGLYGTEQVGQTLKYESDGWGIQGVAETDVWQESTDGGSTWNPLSPQPTGLSYQLQSTDVGNELRMDVTATLPGYNTVHYDSPPVPVYVGVYTVLTQPKVTTTSTAWTISAGTWAPNFGPTNYTWIVAGTPSANTSDSLPKAGTAGESVVVETDRDATGMALAYTPQIVVQEGSAPVPSSALTISGTPQYNTTLQANVPTFTPSISGYGCSWQYKSGTTWKSISGANTCSYTPGLGDLGHILRVVLTTSRLDYKSTTLIATETAPVTALPLTNTIVPIVSGTIGTADGVSAGNGAWSSTPSGFTYRWVYSATGVAPWKIAPGASNESSYVIPQSLLNQWLGIEVTASLSGHVTTTVLKTAGQVVKDSLTVVSLPKAKLTGTPATGETLTEYGVAYSPAATLTNFNWDVYAPNNSIAVYSIGDTTNVPFAIPSADVHDVVRLQVSGTAPDYESTNYTDAVVVKDGDNLPTGSLTLGSAAVGAPESSSGLSWAVNATTLSYQWQYELGSTWKSISGATSSAFTPSSTYFGRPIRLIETAKAANYNTASATSNAVTVTAGAAAVAGTGGNSPSFTGQTSVGATLTVNPGTWSTTGLTFSYQWQTSPNGVTWTNITGATTSHVVVPVSAYVNSDYLGVVIKASKSGYTTGQTLFSTPGTALESNVPMIKAPVVKVTSTTLSVSSGTWGGVAPVTYQYSWLAYSPTGTFTVLSTSPSSTPVISRSLVPAGDAIYVDVAAKEPGYYDPGSIELFALTGGPITPTTPITVTGTPSTLNTLTASWSGFSVSSPTIGYQWYRSGVAISGQKGQQYTPVGADIGKIDSVIVTVSEAGWTTEKYSAASTVIQSGDTIGADTSPLITGTPAVDDVLTVHSAVWNQPGVVDHYQWMRGNLPITDATGTNYTVTATDLSDDIYVVETGSKAYFTDDVTEGGPVTIGLGAQLAPATPIKILGTVAVGKVLTETSGAWNYPVTLTYTWEYQAQGSFLWNTISGATASTYTPSVADGTNGPGTIRVIVHAFRPGHDPISILSEAVFLS